MKIYYTFGFTLNPKTGRGEGSLRKIEALLEEKNEVIVFSYVAKFQGAYILHKAFNAIYQLITDIYYLLKEGKAIDVVIIRDNIFFPFWLAKLRGVPVCAEVHAAGWEETGNSNIKRLFSAPYKLFSISSLRKSDMVIYNHPELKRYFSEHHSIVKPSLISYNAGIFSIPDRRRSVEEDKPDHISYVYAGNIHPWHGVDLLPPILGYWART